MVGGLSLVLLFVGSKAKKKGTISPTVRLWPLVLIFLAGIGVWCWNEWTSRSTPQIAWTQLGVEVLDAARPEDRTRYEQARIIVDGTVPMSLLLTPHDLENLNRGRRASNFVSEDGLAGINFAVFESNEIWKCPRSLAVTDGNFNAFLGIYVVRDGQLPNIRLATIGKNVKVGDYPSHESHYRLLAVVFPLDASTSKSMLERDFNPEKVFGFEWQGNDVMSKNKGRQR